MRKTFGLFAPLMLSLMLLFTACEDNDSTSLTGSWRAATLALTDSSGKERKASLPAEWNGVLVIHADGTFTFASTKDGHAESGKGQWSQTDDHLTFSYNGDGQMEYTIDGDRLVLSRDIPEGHFQLFWTKTD